METARTEHQLFELGVFAKGIHGALEAVGALFIFTTSGTTITHILTNLLSFEISEDPNDYLANLILSHAEVSTAGKDFIALYLLVSACVNIIICTGLLLHRKHMFPVAIALLSAFAVYQLYLFSHTFSPWLIALTLYDGTLAFLIHAEYRRRWPILSPPSIA